MRGSVLGNCSAACLATFSPEMPHVLQLKQVGRIFSWRVAPAKHFHFGMAGVAQAVDAHGILFLMNLFEQPRLQHHALLAIKKTFKNAELDPCAKARQGAVYARAPPIIGDIVAHNIEHGVTFSHAKLKNLSAALIAR